MWAYSCFVQPFPCRVGLSLHPAGAEGYSTLLWWEGTTPLDIPGLSQSKCWGRSNTLCLLGSARAHCTLQNWQVFGTMYTVKNSIRECLWLIVNHTGVNVAVCLKQLCQMFLSARLCNILHKSFKTSMHAWNGMLEIRVYHYFYAYIFVVILFILIIKLKNFSFKPYKSLWVKGTTLT